MALPTYNGAGAAVGAITDIAPAWPTHAADDIGVLVVEMVPGTQPAAPDGFTAHPASPIASPAPAATQLVLYGKRATSSSEAAATVAIGTHNHLLGQIFTIRGASTSGAWYDAIDVYETGVSTEEVTALSVPGDTTTGADRLVVIISTRGDDNASTTRFSDWANADLANLTEQGEAGTAAGNGGGFAIVTGEKATAGAYGATTATIGIANQYACISMAFKPPAAGGAVKLLIGGNLINRSITAGRLVA